MFNTLYYLIAFGALWFSGVASVTPGQGFEPAMKQLAKVLALVWVGSQTTKPLRAGGALMLAPLMDRALAWMHAKLGLPSKLYAFVLLTVLCIASAAAAFGAAALSVA